MRIYRPTEITDELVIAFARLMPQLSANTLLPAKEFLQEVIHFEGSHLLVAEEDGVIYGTLTLVVYKIPTGKKARIEDVIVDASARGRGVATQLLERAIALCREEEISKLDLTSSPSREAAHGLYLKMGFEERETSVFRLLL